MENQEQTNSPETSAPEAPKAQEQKEAVYALALAALTDKPAEGQPLKSLVTKDVRKTIRVGLYAGIKNGTIKYVKSGKTDGELKKYCSSLINNWLKKDPRFN